MLRSENRASAVRFLENLASERHNGLQEPERERLLEIVKLFKMMSFVLSPAIMQGWFETVTDIVGDNEDIDPRKCAASVYDEWERFCNNDLPKDFEEGVVEKVLAEQGWSAQEMHITDGEIGAGE